jgi:hypothetical protein
MERRRIRQTRQVKTIGVTVTTMSFVFGYDKKLGERLVPNGLVQNSPFYERFEKQIGEYGPEGYCRSPLLNLFNEYQQPFKEELIDDLSSSPYFYLVEMLYSLSVWLPRPRGGESLLSPWPQISETARRHFRERKAYLVVTHFKKAERDPYIFHLFFNLDKKLKELGIPSDRVIFLGCSEDLVTHYQRTLAAGQINPLADVRSIPYFEWGWDTYFRRYESMGQTLTIDEARATLDEPKPFRYLCFNREPRAHRLVTLLWLQARGLLSQGLVSFPQEDDYFAFNKFDQYGEGVGHIFKTPEILSLRGEIPAVKARLPLLVDHPDLFGLHISWCSKEPFKKTYFSVLTERLFHNPNGHLLLTSKAYKAICNLHPFVLIGPSGALAALKEAGYRTFSPWIDERYDDEKNPDLRIQLAWAEIERLCRMPENEILAWYRAVFPILEHNITHYRKRNSENPVQAFARELLSSAN